MPVKYGDLLDAYLFVDSAESRRSAAFIDKASGEIYWRFSDDDEFWHRRP